MAPEAMSIQNPKRILLLGPPDAGHLELLKELTGTQPTQISPDTLSGLSHALSIDTTYYNAIVPIWIDEIPLDNPAPWTQEFSQPEAAEVLEAVGACVLVVRKPSSDTEATAIKNLLSEITKVFHDNNEDTTLLVVGMKQSILPNLASNKSEGAEWEDDIMDLGWEWIDAEKTGKNEFGELCGIERLREVLETCDWNFDDDTLDGMTADEFLDTATLDIDNFMRDLENDEVLMKRPILDVGQGTDKPVDEDQGDDDSMEGLQAMLSKVHAIREMGAELPLAERRKFASKEVAKILKTL